MQYFHHWGRSGICSSHVCNPVLSLMGQHFLESLVVPAISLASQSPFGLFVFFARYLSLDSATCVTAALFAHVIQYYFFCLASNNTCLFALACVTEYYLCVIFTWIWGCPATGNACTLGGTGWENEPCKIHYETTRGKTSSTWRERERDGDVNMLPCACLPSRRR